MKQKSKRFSAAFFRSGGSFSQKSGAMLRRKGTALILVMATSLARGQEFAVIAERYSATPLKAREATTLVPGQVVKIRSAQGNLLIVEDLDRPWATEGGMLVPGEILAKQTTFESVREWMGERQIEVVAGDYVANYTFKPNGRFVYRSSDEKGRPILVHGRLQRSRNVLWAKRGARQSISKEDIFIIMPGGKLCWPVPPSECTLAP